MHYSASTLHGNNNWPIMEKNHVELLNVVTPTKLFCCKPGMGLELYKGYKMTHYNTSNTNIWVYYCLYCTHYSDYLHFTKLMQGNKDN